jgi:hypothetical protein
MHSYVFLVACDPLVGFLCAQSTDDYAWCMICCLQQTCKTAQASVLAMRQLVTKAVLVKRNMGAAAVSKALKTVAMACPRLTELDCWYDSVKYITDKNLLPVAANCEQLERISLASTACTERICATFAINCPKVTWLNIDDNQGLAGLRYLGERIITLQLWSILLSTTEDVRLLARYCPLLQDLFFGAMWRRDDELQRWPIASQETFDKLQKLAFEGCALDGEAALEAVPSCPRLTELKLGSSDYYRAPEEDGRYHPLLTAPAMLQLRESCTQVKDLQIEGWDAVPYSLDFQNWRELEVLTLERINWRWKPMNASLGWFRLPRGLTHLILRFVKIKDAEADGICMCSSLQYLRLDNCDSLSDAWLETLARPHPEAVDRSRHLNELDIEECRLLTRRATKRLATALNLAWSYVAKEGMSEDESDSD